MGTAFEVTYGGKTKALLEWLRGVAGVPAGAQANVRDLVKLVGSVLLATSFADKAPEYPIFSVQITEKNRPQAAEAALRWLKGPAKPQQGGAVLDALGLLDGDRLDPSRSRYARYIRSKLLAKGSGQVLNRGEIIEDVNGVEYMAPGPPERYRLEPEWAAVLLATLVYSGEAALALPGRRLDAGNFDLLVATPVSELAQFKHVEQPKEWNVPALRALFGLLEKPPGYAQLVVQGSAEPVQELQTAAAAKIDDVVRARQHLQAGLSLWGRALLDEAEQNDLRERLDGLKTFLESLQPFTSPGRLKNFPYSGVAVDAQRAGTKALATVAGRQELVTVLGPVASYLAQAQLVLPPVHPWQKQADDAKAELLNDLNSGTTEAARRALPRLEQLRRDYIAMYSARHTKARLNLDGDRRKARLLKDERLQRLDRLASISFLPIAQLTTYKERLAGLQSCFALAEQDLQAAPTCPHCGFRPAAEPAAAPVENQLEKLDGDLDTLGAEWTATLLDNLEDPTTSATLELLSPPSGELVSKFLQLRALPQDVGKSFVNAVQEALSSLVRVNVSASDLMSALLAGGSPATPAELRGRFDTFLSGLANGTDAAKIRIVLE